MFDFLKNKYKRTILLMVLSAVSLMVSFLKISFLPFDIAWISIAFCGIPILKEAFMGLFTRFDIKADLLVSMALISSVIINEIFAAGEVAFIMAIGGFLEEMTVKRARAGIEKLVNMTPQTARVIRSGNEYIMPSSEVKVGDMIRILAGETIPVDGVITHGRTSINQSVMTGESLPVDKQKGDKVLSGTINQFGTFDMKAIKIGKNSSLQRMIRLVKAADTKKSRIVGIADKAATWIVAAALISSLITWIITGEILRSVTILVVFCPCALVLATPTAIMAGMGNAARYGILIKEGDALERLAGVNIMCFDKTGTLTYGTLSVAAVEVFNPDFNEEKFIRLAASAETRSEHPIGKAVVNYARSLSNMELSSLINFKMVAGRGIDAVVDGYHIIAGNMYMILENNITVNDHMKKAAIEHKNMGCTIMYVAVDDKLSGFIALSDTVRKESNDVIENIQKNRMKSILLTGDNEEAARYIGDAIGVDEICSNCLPNDKISKIQGYQNKNQKVCMVGDGVNDALALKKSYVGISMAGGGSDIAVDASDIALVSDDIKYIPHLIGLSKKVSSTIKINIAFSMTINFIAVIFAAAGILKPVLGALVHNAGSVVVILNSALLLKWKRNI